MKSGFNSPHRAKCLAGHDGSVLRNRILLGSARSVAAVLMVWLSVSCSVYTGVSHLGQSYAHKSDCTWFYGASAIDLGLTAVATVLVSADIASGGTMDCSTQANEPKQCSKLSNLAIPTVFALSSLWGYYQGHSCSKQFAQSSAVPNGPNTAANRPPATVVNGREARRREVEQLTKTAATAALAADCETVKTIDAQVRAIDSGYYDTVFVRDAGIARCLIGNLPPPITQPRN
jgi:hypothetical protein